MDLPHLVTLLRGTVLSWLDEQRVARGDESLASWGRFEHERER